jgi:hypothetical protein
VLGSGFVHPCKRQATRSDDPPVPIEAVSFGRAILDGAMFASRGDIPHTNILPT